MLEWRPTVRVIRCRAVQAAPKATVFGFLKLFMCRKPFSVVFHRVTEADTGMVEEAVRKI